MDKKYEAIGVLDSGLGGLSVLREAIKIMPNENFIYYGDSKNAPYGVKSLEQVKKLTFDVVEYLLCLLGVFPALAFVADFPSVALKFHQRTHRVRLRNLGTTDKKSSHKIKHRKISREHYFTKEGLWHLRIYMSIQNTAFWMALPRLRS